MKKLLLSIGTVAAIATPITAVISCGKKDSKTTAKPPVATTQSTTQTAPAEHAKRPAVVDQATLGKEFLNSFMADEKLLLEPIKHDSNEKFINNVIRIWTDVQKTHNITPTFEDGFIFDQSNASSITDVTNKVTPIIKGLASGLISNFIKGNSLISSVLSPILDKAINAELIKGFISEKWLSTGLGFLVKHLLDNILGNSMVAPIMNADLIGGLLPNMLVPFAKDEVKNQDIKLEYNSGTITFALGEKKSPRSFFSNIDLSGISSAASGNVVNSEGTHQEVKTKLGLSSLMKVVGDTSVANFVSGLIHYLSTDQTISSLLSTIFNKYAQKIVHAHGENPFATRSQPLLSFQVDSSKISDEDKAKRNIPIVNRETLGLVNWLMTIDGNNYTFKNSNGEILARGVKDSSGKINLTFTGLDLPLKTTAEGVGLLGNNTHNLTTISVKELATEYYIKDIADIGSLLLEMIIGPMAHYVKKSEANNPLTMNLDSRIRMAEIIENGLNVETSGDIYASQTLSSSRWLKDLKQKQSALLASAASVGMTGAELEHFISIMEERGSLAEEVKTHISEVEAAKSKVFKDGETFEAAYNRYKKMSKEDKAAMIASLYVDASGVPLEGQAKLNANMTDHLFEDFVLNNEGKVEKTTKVNAILEEMKSTLSSHPDLQNMLSPEGTFFRDFTAFRQQIAAVSFGDTAWLPKGFADIKGALLGATEV